MSANPREIIDDGNMHFMQWVAIALMIMLNALDGFDVLSSAFAGPGIKAEWGLGPDGLGAVLSMELVGMGFGSLLLGGAADKYGRRPTILFCLTLMASGMFLATTADSPQALSAWRFLTGLGIGGMLASINAVTAELSSKKARSVAMALMVIGYPLGAFFGGLVASDLLQTRDWRSVFMFGGIMTAIMIPMVLLFVPETPAFLNQKRPENALSRINKILARYGHQTIDAMPALAPGAVKARIMDLFSPAMIRTTFILAVGYSFHALTFYYILKLAPSIISDPQFAGQSFTRSEGASVLAYANLGGALGGAAFGWFMHKFGVKRSTQVALAFSAVFVAAFGFGHSSLLGWTLGVIAVGLFTNAAIVGFYTAFAASYPTQLRATGTGFALSVGRGGAALSPYLAGVLFGAGLGLLKVSLIMGLGSLIALLLFSMLKLNNPEDAKT